MTVAVESYHQPPTTSHPPVRVEWFSNPADLTALETPWRALEASVQHRTHASTYDFLYTWYRHYAGEYGGTPLVGCAWAGSDLIGVAPLTLRRGSLGRIPVTRVDFAPSDSIAGEFLVRDDRPDVAAALLDSLVHQAKFDVVCLNGFDPASPLLPTLQAAARQHHFGVELEGHAFAMVDLRRGYDTYWAALHGDVRRKLNHRARKIEALGAAVDGVLPGHSLEAARALATRMIAITEASYKLQGQRLADHHREFLIELVDRFARRGMLSLPVLTIGGRDAAFILGVVERGCFFDVTLSYDESFAKLGPGMYLMQATLTQFASAGIHTVVSHGAHEYKRAWSTAFVPQTRLFLFPPRPRAAATRLVRFGLRPLWRRLDADATARERQ
jgi:CelD/BcsL family acetyltransferase involved in cellulose biosynthesis